MFVNCCWHRIFHVGAPGLFQPCLDDLICFSHPPWGVRAEGRGDLVFCFSERFCAPAGVSRAVVSPSSPCWAQSGLSLLVWVPKPSICPGRGGCDQQVFAAHHCWPHHVHLCHFLGSGCDFHTLTLTSPTHPHQPVLPMVLPVGMPWTSSGVLQAFPWDESAVAELSRGSWMDLWSCSCNLFL